MHLIAHLVVHLTNEMFVGRTKMQMQMFMVRIQMQMQMYKTIWRHLNARSNAQHSNAHSNTFAFVDKPVAHCIAL